MVERGPCGYKFQSTKLSSFSCNESFLKTMFVSSQNMGNHFYIVHLLKGPSGFFLIHGKSDISKRFVRFSCGVHFKGSWYSALSPELRYLHF